MVRAVIYARVSSDPTKELRSVEGQVDEGRRFIATQPGWTLAREPFIDNDRSASRHRRKDRPDYQELITHLRAGEADALVLWAGSRAQRDLRDYLRLRDVCADQGVLYVMNGRVYDMTRTDDRFQTGLDALLSEREADTIRDNVLRGMRKSALDGRPSGRLLYGYRREYSDTGAFLAQVPHPVHAAVVRDIYERADRGETLTAIARRLNEAGTPTPRGGQLWRPTTVRSILTNVGYCGKRVFRKEVAGDACWDGLIDDELWERVNLRLADPGRRVQRGTELKYQLVGAARCGVCPPDADGKPVPLRSVVGRRGLTGYGCRQCNSVFCRADWLDDFINALVVARLQRPDAAAVFDPAADTSAVTALRGEVKRLRERLNEHYAQSAAGALSAAGLAAVERMLLPQIEEAEARLKTAATPPALRGVDPVKLAADWPNTPVHLRRDVIAALADIVLDPRREFGNRFDPGRLGRSRWHGDPLTWAERWAGKTSP